MNRLQLILEAISLEFVYRLAIWSETFTWGQLFLKRRVKKGGLTLPSYCNIISSHPYTPLQSATKIPLYTINIRRAGSLNVLDAAHAGAVRTCKWLAKENGDCWWWYNYFVIMFAIWFLRWRWAADLYFQEAVLFLSQLRWWLGKSIIKTAFVLALLPAPVRIGIFDTFFCLLSTLSPSVPLCQG